jgi:hypothetical protein
MCNIFIEWGFTRNYLFDILKNIMRFFLFDYWLNTSDLNVEGSKSKSKTSKLVKLIKIIAFYSEDKAKLHSIVSL